MRLLLKTTFFFLFVLAIFPNKLWAQDLESDSITVRPAIIDAFPNQTYELTIKNNSDEVKNFRAIPSAFTVLKEERRVIPVDNPEINFDEYLSIETAQLILNSKESENVKVQFIKSHENYILGVTFAESVSSNPEIGTTMQLASLFLDRNITDEYMLQITSDLNVRPKFSLGSISFGKSYNLSSTVVNETPLFLAGSGEVRVLSEETRLDSLSLTQDFPPNIYPAETVSVETKFEDKRSVLGRIGLIKFEQKVYINNREILVEKQVISIPFEIVALALTILLTSALIYTIYRNIKSEKTKAQIRRPKRRVKSRNKVTIDIGKELQKVN